MVGGMAIIISKLVPSKSSKARKEPLCPSCGTPTICSNASDAPTLKTLSTLLSIKEINAFLLNWWEFLLQLVKRAFPHSWFRMSEKGNRRNRQNRLFVLYFVGEARRGQGAFQNRQNRQHRQNRHEGYPSLTQPHFSDILSWFAGNGPKPSQSSEEARSPL